MATNEILDYAGKVIIDEIILTSSDGSKSLDIFGMFSELDIFEDIYAPTITGSLSLVDGFNLISNFPILGEEFITFKCHTPTIKTSFTKKFAVIGVGDKVVGSAAKQVYFLKFASIETLVDIHTKVYRAFTGTPSDSAAQVFNKYFTPITGAKFVVENCSNAIKIVAPTVSPFKFINMLASKAIDVSGYGAPSFLFFEDNQTYNFISLTTLYKQSPITTLRYSFTQMRNRDDNGESTRDINAEYATVKDMNIDDLFNTIEKTMHGSLGNKVIEVDLMRKSTTKKTYSYMDNFDNVTHLNTAPTNSNSLYRKLGMVEDVVQTSILHPASQDNFPQDRDGDILSKRIPLINGNEFIKFDIVVHGRTDIKVGDVINFEMGKFQTINPDVALTDDGIDQYYSGNYLIAAIQHRITQTRHESVYQIVKDSFNSTIDFTKKK
jgi:hypothetical protein